MKQEILRTLTTTISEAIVGREPSTLATFVRLVQTDPTQVGKDLWRIIAGTARETNAYARNAQDLSRAVEEMLREAFPEFEAHDGPESCHAKMLYREFLATMLIGDVGRDAAIAHLSGAAMMALLVGLEVGLLHLAAPNAELEKWDELVSQYDLGRT